MTSSPKPDAMTAKPMTWSEVANKVPGQRLLLDMQLKQLSWRGQGYPEEARAYRLAIQALRVAAKERP